MQRWSSKRGAVASATAVQQQSQRDEERIAALERPPSVSIAPLSALRICGPPSHHHSSLVVSYKYTHPASAPTLCRPGEAVAPWPAPVASPGPDTRSLNRAILQQPTPPKARRGARLLEHSRPVQVAGKEPRRCAGACSTRRRGGGRQGGPLIQLSTAGTRRHAVTPSVCERSTQYAAES